METLQKHLVAAILLCTNVFCIISPEHPNTGKVKGTSMF